MSRSKEEIFLRDLKNPKKSFKLNLRVSLEDQRWLYYLIIGSFGILVILNYTLPNVYLTESKPVYDLKDGLMGLILMFFGIFFVFNALIIGDIKFWIIEVVLFLIFVYFGLPFLLGMKLW